MSELQELSDLLTLRTIYTLSGNTWKRQRTSWGCAVSTGQVGPFRLRMAFETMAPMYRARELEKGSMTSAVFFHWSVSPESVALTSPAVASVNTLTLPASLNIGGACNGIDFRTSLSIST